MSALDELRTKTDRSPLENAVALFADYELEARKDGKNIIAERAAAELATLRRERDELIEHHKEHHAELDAIQEERDDFSDKLHQMTHNCVGAEMERDALTARLQAAEGLVTKWTAEAWNAVPVEYGSRKLHYKYFKLDNEAAGMVTCAEELAAALKAAEGETK